MAIIKDLITGKQESFCVLENKTIRECINEFKIISPLIELNGKKTTNLDYKLKENDILNFYIYPKKSGKDIFKTIAIVAISGFAANALLGTSLSGVSSLVRKGVRALATGVIATEISKAVIKPQSQTISGYSGDPRNPSISATQNNTNPYGVVPKLMGCMRVYPYKVGEYTEVIGKDEYLRTLFLISSGKANISDLKIGDTSIDNYEDVEYEIIEEKTSSSDITLFTNDIDTDSVGTLIESKTEYVERTSSENARELSFDFGLREGLYDSSSGSVARAGVRTIFEYKKTSETTWTTLRDHIIAHGNAYEVTEGVTAWVDNTLLIGGFDFGDSYTSSTKKAFTILDLDEDQYDIRMRLDTNSVDSSDTYHNKIWLETLKTIKYIDPAPVGNSYIAVKIKGTDQLNGTIQTLNCLAKQYIDVWDGSVWTETLIDTLLETDDISFQSNIAWCFAEVLRGSENRKALDDSRIDLDTLLDWDTRNTTAGYTFNAYLDSKKTILEVLKDIASVGRAMPIINTSGKYSVAQDKEQTLAKQMFTTRNITNYSFSKVFKTQPDAIKGIFKNEKKDFDLDEIVVSSDGEILDSTGDLTNTEEYKAFGMTKYENIFKHIRYIQTTSIMRAIQHSFEVDFEYLVVNRGDKILLQHDVLNEASKSFRIKSVTSDATITSITVDEECNMETGTDYGIIIRHFDGTNTTTNTYAIVNNPSENKTLTFETALDLDEISIDDLGAFGELVRITDELIVSEINPMVNMRARMNAYNYNTAVYDVDQEGFVIPTFTSKITKSVSKKLNIPSNPTISNIISDESVLIKKGDGTLISQIVFDLNYSGQVKIENFQVQYRLSEATSQYVTKFISFDDAKCTISDVNDGDIYEIRARAVTKFGMASDWVSTAHTVIGKTSSPANVSNFSVSVIKENFVYSWTLNTEKDISHYEIRKGTDWETADFVSKIFTNKFSTNEGVTGIGNVTFLIKAVDTTGNESENVASASYIVQAPAKPVLSYGTVQNTVSIDWQNCKTTFPIQRYEIRKGETFETAEILNNNVSGSFYRYNEDKAGMYKYWVIAEDTAENQSIESYIEINVDDPPGFSFIDNFEDDFSGIKTNALLENSSLVTMIDTTETWNEHFSNNGWTTLQNQIDAGFAYFLEPTKNTAKYEQVFDLGVVTTGGGVIVAVENTETVDGNTTVTTDIAVSTDNITYTTYTDVLKKLVEISFRYIKVTLNYSGADGNDLMKTTRLNVSVGLQDIRDAGQATITTQGQTVNTTKSFARIDNITPSILTAPPSGKTWAAPYALNQTPGIPASFDVYINTTDGTALGGLSSVEVSWSIDGK